MFTPNELESVPEALNRIYRDLQLNIMSDIVERLSVNKDISRTADWEISRLYELGVSKRAIKKRIKDTFDLTTREINRIYQDVIWQDYARYEPIYKTKGKPWIPFEKNKQLQQLIKGISEQTNNDCYNITQSLGFAVKQPDGTTKFKPIAKYYQDTLDNAAMGMLSGAFDYNTMIKKAVKEMTDSGLRTVDYASGWSNRVDVAARRALMTGFNQVVAKITEDNAEQLGTNHFEVTYHRGARPTHQPWQGRVYTMEQLIEVCGYGEVDGLKGANCYHDFHPFFVGISKRIYTDEELDRMNAEENTPKKYGKREYTVYEALQRQRRLETKLRAQRQKIKLLEQGDAAEDDIIAEKAKYYATSDEYAKFSKAMDLPQQRERINADGLKDFSLSKHTDYLTVKDYNDIIYMKGKMSNSAVRKWYVAHDKSISDLIDKSLSIEQQARQACNLRNQFRTQARDLMADQEARKQLDIFDPNKSFEELVADKMNRKELSRDEAIKDILKTATKTRKSVNKKFGLE